MLKCWNTEILEHWNTEMLKYWNAEMLKGWNAKLLKYWNEDAAREIVESLLYKQKKSNFFCKCDKKKIKKN